MNRDQLVTAIRTQLDIDEEDLPLATAQMFLTEAFHRTAARERRWPSMEAEWEYIFAAGEKFRPLDPSTAEIKSVVNEETGHRLAFADHDVVKDAKSFTASSSSLFSTWAGRIYVWPAPWESTTLSVSGYRQPSTNWLSDPALQVDLDERLHIPMLHYAIALAYAQQEDPELEAMYMRRWDMGVEDVRSNIMRSGVYRPIVLNGGIDLGLGFV